MAGNASWITATKNASWKLTPRSVEVPELLPQTRFRRFTFLMKNLKQIFRRFDRRLAASQESDCVTCSPRLKSKKAAWTSATKQCRQPLSIFYPRIPPKRGGKHFPLRRRIDRVNVSVTIHCWNVALTRRRQGTHRLAKNWTRIASQLIS